uniref:Uncharacterized protein n=1 Tax=Tanacetum cinerariifolium TaxID=118510 RepID=A0A6L2LAT9_TANCI|nr:hypothetical protein [Tanacetum cinerariifolium]
MNKKCIMKEPNEQPTLSKVWRGVFIPILGRSHIWETSVDPVCLVKVREEQLIGHEIVQKTTENISLVKDRLKAACDRQKINADKRRKPLEFSVGDHVLLKVSPWKGLVRFGKKGKLAPRFVRPFEITERIGLIPLEEIQVDAKLNFVEEPIEILEREFKKLKKSRIPIVKGLISEIRMIFTSSNPTTVQAAVGLAYRLTNDVISTCVASKGQDGGRKRQNDQQRNQDQNQQNKRREGNGTDGRKPSCYECRSLDHLRIIYPRLNRAPNNNNNTIGNPRASTRGRVYVIDAEEAVHDPNVVMGTFLLNGHYMSVLFDYGVDRIFVSLEIRPLLEQKSKSLNELYTIEYANGHEYEAREILLDYKLNLNDGLFDIDLITIELKSFNIDGKTLIVQGENPARDLRIISAIKMRKYLKRECFAFLAHVVEKDKKVKRIQDIPVVRNYLEVFPEDLPGLPPSRQVEFQIDLVPGASLVAKAPYCLAPIEMQELSAQLQEILSKGLIGPTQFLSHAVNAKGIHVDPLEARVDGIKYLNERALIPNVNNLRKIIMDEAHRSRYSIHPRDDDIYMDVKEYYWWPGMKKNIALYVGKCLTCAKVKAKHQKPSRLLEQSEIPLWKWEKIMMDLVTRLPKTSRGHDSIWVIVDQLTKSAHFLPI